ncbi:MAG: hypothetical protein QOJ01_2016 [Solirubrobacterales bacterium]|nr:hypothetical protein [Solirubrobacterales bacterium]
MELVPYRDSDLRLTAALEGDPVVMKELGGPLSPEEIRAAHGRRMVAAASGWWLTIVPEPAGEPVGTIGAWPITWEGEETHETGWMVLSAFHGQGIATEALRLLLERARPEFAELHAFPGRTNPASNALCRKFGFELLGECDGDYAGRPLHCNHWRVALDGPPRSA